MSVNEIPREKPSASSVPAPDRSDDVSLKNARPGAHRSLINAAFLVVQPLLLNAFSIPATAFIIRRLGQEGYGQYTAAAALCATLGSCTRLGFNSFYVRAVAQEAGKVHERMKTQMAFRMLLAVGAGAIAVLAAWLLRYPSAVIACVVVGAVSLAMTAVTGVMTDTLQGLDRIRSYSSVNLVAGIAVTAATVAVVWRGFGPVGLSIAYLINPIVCLGMMAFLLRKAGLHPGLRIAWREFAALLRQVKVVGAGRLVVTLRDGMEGLLAPLVTGLSSFGYFSAGTLVAEKLNVVPDGLCSAYYPPLARKWASDRADADQTLAQLITLCIGIAMPAAIAVSALARPIAALLFPQHINECDYIIRLSIWALVVSALAMPFGYGVLCANLQDRAAKITMLSAPFTILCTLVLIRNFGVLGACYSYVLRPVILNAFLTPLYVSNFRSAIRQVPAARIAIGSALMYLAIVLVRNTHLPALPALFCGLFLGTGAYLAMMRCIVKLDVFAAKPG